MTTISHKSNLIAALANGRATLYLGDCRELLAAGLLKCDAIVRRNGV